MSADNSSSSTGSFEALRSALFRYSEFNPESIITLGRGERLINQGELSDASLYLIKNGAVGIMVRHPGGGASEETVALRTIGDFVGEMTFLTRSSRRTASVMVASRMATFVKVSKLDVFDLVRQDSSLEESLKSLWELAVARRDETRDVLEGRITVENRVMSVILTDIHNFTALGEAALEEHTNSFLFEFMEASDQIAKNFDAILEDQGDGHKIIISENNLVERAIGCAISVADAFTTLREQWVPYSDAFRRIGLGIGICTDLMSVRRLKREVSARGRVLSHAINVAAAISKFRREENEVEIYLDENSASMAKRQGYRVTGPQQQWLKGLGRYHSLYHIERVLLEQLGQNVEKLQTKALVAEDRIGILFLSSEPAMEVQLRLAKEAREIELSLRSAKFRNRFSFKQLPAVRPKDFSQEVLEFEPQIIHFSGHGASSGEIVLEGDDGGVHVVEASALARLFKETRGVQCVVLNACYSAVQAEAIAAVVGNVIGMNSAIRDEAAIAFSIGFYRALGAGKSIAESYRLGCADVHIQDGESSASIPVLLSK